MKYRSFNALSAGPLIRVVLLLALISSFVAAQPPIARAAAGTIIVEIFQAESIRRGVDNIWPPTSPQDFYPKLALTIFKRGGGTDGTGLIQGPEIEQRDWAAWEPSFQVSKATEIDDMGSPIARADVQLWDNDVFIDEPDDQFDINPQAGMHPLPLQFDVCTLRYNREGSATAFTGRAWMPVGDDSEYPARVEVNVRTADGRSFLANNVAIADATPVQAVYHPRYIIEQKPTAFKVDLTSSHTVPVNGTLTVTMSDGFSTVTDSKPVVIPPEGLRAFLFDGSSSAGPFQPRKQPNLQRLTYTVTVDVPADSNLPDPGGPFPNCVPAADNTLSSALPMIRTKSPITLYLPWDWGSTAVPGDSITANPPTVAQVRSTFESNEMFRRAIFPISDTVSATFPGFATSVRTIGEPVPTIIGWSIAAHAVGIDRLMLIPRRGWFSENAGRLDFGDGAAGMSLAEFAPHAVLAEQGLSEVAVHEQGHTYLLSQRRCSTGGLAEDLFLLGCRDEYNHAAADGRPYRGSGFDVRGQVYAAGAGGMPGTREVLNITNFMDTTPAVDGGAYDRWIDNPSYDWLSERMRLKQDPELVSISGMVRIPGGLGTDPSTSLEGALLPSFRYMGDPDMEAAALNDKNGTGIGQFYARIVTPQGFRIYRFTPAFEAEESDTQGEAGFSFAVPWDATTTRIELVGPATRGDISPQSNAEKIYATLTVSQAGPKVTTIQAGINKPPVLTVAPGNAPVAKGSDSIVLAWDQQDADTGSNELTAMVYLIPPQGTTGLGDTLSAVPIAVNVSGGNVALLGHQFAASPGTYGVRVVVSDGANTTSFEAANVFSVLSSSYLPLVRGTTPQ